VGSEMCIRDSVHPTYRTNLHLHPQEKQRLVLLQHVVFQQKSYHTQHSHEDADVSWFYMWGGRGYHQSGQGHDVPGKPNVIQRYSEYIETLRAAGKIPTGEIVLKPNWEKDYNVKLLEFLNKQHASRN
jgi:hypothetical protein